MVTKNSGASWPCPHLQAASPALEATRDQELRTSPTKARNRSDTFISCESDRFQNKPSKNDKSNVSKWILTPAFVLRARTEAAKPELFLCRIRMRLLQLRVQDAQHVRAPPPDPSHHSDVRVRRLPQVPQDTRAAAGAQEVPHRPVWRAQVRKASTDRGS